MKTEIIDNVLLLYVEDDEDTRVEVEHFLKRRIKNVLIASNGKEGHELYLEHKPDIIITDIQMPIMTGLEMSNKIREEDKDTTIIITSAYSDSKYLDEAINIGINTFLLKPISLIQLYCTLKITCDNIILHRKNIKTTNTLNETKQRLVEADKMANLGELVAGVTHEINTPLGVGLTSISHLLELSKDIKKNYKADEMTQEGFEDFLDSSEELSKMIYLNLKRTAQLVKSFKQVAVDQTNEEKRKFKLKEYIEELIFSLNYVIKKTNLIVDIKCEKEIIMNSYPGSFAQIITNFIMNSIKHAYDNNEEGLITIEISYDFDNLTLIYKDDGKGVSPEKLEKLFDKFYTTKKYSGGSGLGLNIVKNLVESNLKGEITSSSIQGEGLSFKIVIPL